MLGRRRVLEFVEDMPQFRNFRIGRTQRGEARPPSTRVQPDIWIISIISRFDLRTM